MHLSCIARHSAAPALAEDYYSNAPGTAEQPPGTTTTQAAEVTSGYLNHETFAFTPQLGVLTYGTPSNGTQVRGVLGFGFDMNAVTAFTSPESRTGAWTNFYIGPQTGLFFAHTGSASANFVGTSATVADVYANAGYTWIPLDLKIGYAFNDNFRLSVHGGGNLVYQSVTGTVNLSNATVVAGSTASGSSWNIYPNVGGDIEFGVGHDISVLLRPDVTIASGTSPFSATAGLGIALS